MKASLLWAKTIDEQNESYLPLPHHLYDVAGVAAVLLENLPPETLKWLARIQNVEPDWLKSLFIFLCGAHDIGKATPYFQIKSKTQAVRLKRLGVPLDALLHRMDPERHGEATHAALCDYLKPIVGSAPAANALAQAIGAHHGICSCVTRDAWESRLGTKPSLPGAQEWKAIQKEILEDLTGRCRLAPKQMDTVAPCLLGFLAGLCSLVDWVGSDQSAFPINHEGENERWTNSFIRARKSLKRKGLGPRQTYSSREFRSLFPFELNPVQLAAAEISRKNARLVLIEALTGDGKTEAAMILAEAWREQYAQNGAYFALPTQATSNQMFRRVVDYLKTLPGDVETHLLHGNAIFSEDYEKLKLGEIFDQDEHGRDDDGGPVASGFLVGPKRGLLGQYGVGTIDQAMLAALKAKHGFIRLFALARKTIILDEIHAYDLYMSEVLDLLLTWLAALDCTVVLLSATLPSVRRRQLLSAFGADCPECDIPFPRITFSEESLQIHCLPIESSRVLKVDIVWIDLEPAIALAVERAREGLCVAIICNTVDRSQRIYSALQEACEEKNIPLDLFHARFPLEDRNRIEKRCLSLYGKDGALRPPGSILVATQVVEQSLDLDFDLLISEVAPIDLLMQRAGRLHRHPRPRAAGAALMLINPRLNASGEPDFEGSRWVYNEYILLKTLEMLRLREGWALPRDSDELIERVYAENESALADPLQDRLCTAENKMRDKEAISIRRAEKQKIEPPMSEKFMSSYSDTLDEDDPTKHATLQAITRESDPSVVCICLFEQPNGSLSLDEAGSEVIRQLSASMVRRIVLRSVSLSNRSIYQCLLKCDPPKSWNKYPVLKHAKLLKFRDFRVALPGSTYSIEIDRRIGLTIVESNGTAL